MTSTNYTTISIIKEQIKANIDLVELIGEDISLEQSGGEWVGHDDRHGSQSNKSLTVTPNAGDGGLWHCFNCSEGGDCFQWVMNYRGLSWPEALQHLAQKAGVALPDMDEETRQRYERIYNDRRELPPVMMAAAEFYHSQLTDEHYQDMAQRWGLTAETVDKFKIGYAPLDGKALAQHLQAVGYGVELLAKTGLFYLNDGPRLADFYRGRVIIPYWRNNQIVYFAGRWFDGCPDDPKVSKYKKLLTQKPDRQYVSPIIDNSYFYGEDSARRAEELLITEGIADCLAALQAGLNCISPVTVRFRKADYLKTLELTKRAGKVFICNDNEQSKAGEGGALDTAAYLEANGVAVRLITLPRPEGVPKVDLAEYFRDNGPDDLRVLMADGRTCWEVKADRLAVPNNPVAAVRMAREFVVKDLAGCDELTAGAIVKNVLKKKFNLDSEQVKDLLKTRRNTAAQGIDGGKEDKDNQADVLINIADGADLFHDDLHEPFARVQVDEHAEIWPIRNNSFKRWLRYCFYNQQGFSANNEAVNQAVGVLEAKAIFEGDERKLNLRVAEHGEAFWYDLADGEWRAVKINPDGWQVVDRPPILFRRYGNTAAQAEPRRGENGLLLLRNFINLKNDEDKNLLLVYVVTCLIPEIPHTITPFHGEKGAAKSTAMRVLRRLVDPAQKELLDLPRDKNDLALILAKNYMPAFDNLDGLQKWQSNILCTAATGGGIEKRKLYTDDDEVILSFLRCPTLNGINLVATKPDLLDRALIFELERIDEDKRREEKEFWSEFEQARPYIVGGMFDALAGAMKIYPNVKLEKLPRMADWCRWGYAVAEALGFGGDKFLDAYMRNMATANDEALTASPVAAAVVALMRGGSEWTGTANALLETLKKVAEVEKIDTNSRSWPKAGNILSRRLKEVKSNLRDSNIQIFEDYDGHRKHMKYRLLKGSKNKSASSARYASPTTAGENDAEIHADICGDTFKTYAGSTQDLRAKKSVVAGVCGGCGDSGVKITTLTGDRDKKNNEGVVLDASGIPF